MTMTLRCERSLDGKRKCTLECERYGYRSVVYELFGDINWREIHTSQWTRDEGKAKQAFYRFVRKYVKIKEKGNPKLNNHLIENIIDGFDDFLEKKGVVIPNDERDEQDPDCGSNIWGDDFDELMEMVREVCRIYNVVIEDKW